MRDELRELCNCCKHKVENSPCKLYKPTVRYLCENWEYKKRRRINATNNTN